MSYEIGDKIEIKEARLGPGYVVSEVWTPCVIVRRGWGHGSLVVQFASGTLQEIGSHTGKRRCAS